jgi:hypothetical protein
MFLDLINGGICHEGVWGSRGTAHHYLPRHLKENLIAVRASPRVSPEADKNLLPMPGIQPRPSNQSLY